MIPNPSAKQTHANNDDPDQTAPRAQLVRGLHCPPLYPHPSTKKACRTDNVINTVTIFFLVVRNLWITATQKIIYYHCTSTIIQIIWLRLIMRFFSSVKQSTGLYSAALTHWGSIPVDSPNTVQPMTMQHRVSVLLRTCGAQPGKAR